MTNLNETIAPYVEAVERELQRRVPPPEGVYRPFYGMIHYHLGWTTAEFESERGPRGKRIRPVLCLLACEALGGDVARAMPAAAAVELLHEFSLIHDDIQDGDHERRHRPTVWVTWGEAHAINAGDGLFALAQLALGGLAENGLPADLVVEAQIRFNRTAVRLCQGQFLDMSFEQRAEVDPDEYLAMINGKTAALIGFAAEVGGLVAGGSDEELTALQTFGEALGMAFQMQDDLLGLWGNPERTGKPAANDLRKHKKSLPITIGLADPSPHGARFRSLYARETLDEEAVAEALHLLERIGANGRVRSLAHQEHQRAMDALERLRIPAERRRPLQTLAEALLDRDY